MLVFFVLIFLLLSPLSPLPVATSILDLLPPSNKTLGATDLRYNFHFISLGLLITACVDFVFIDSNFKLLLLHEVYKRKRGKKTLPGDGGGKVETSYGGQDGREDSDEPGISFLLLYFVV